MYTLFAGGLGSVFLQCEGQRYLWEKPNQTKILLCTGHHSAGSTRFAGSITVTELLPVLFRISPRVIQYVAEGDDSLTHPVSVTSTKTLVSIGITKDISEAITL